MTSFAVIMVAVQCFSIFHCITADFKAKPDPDEAQKDGGKEPVSTKQEKAPAVVTCQSLEVHQMSITLDSSIREFRNEAANCCGVEEGEASLVDYWTFPCQVDSGYNEVWNLDSTMGECGYKHDSQGLTFLLADRVTKHDDSMSSFMNVYHGASELSKFDIKDDPTIQAVKDHFGGLTGVGFNCMTITDWYINPKVDEDGGQMLNDKKLSDYDITSKGKKRMIIVLENVACKKLTPGTWIMYRNNLIANIECGNKQLVSDFKARASEKTGIPVETMWAFDLLPNSKQDEDGGQLLSHREMSYYGGCNNKIYVIAVIKKCAEKA